MRVFMNAVAIFPVLLKGTALWLIRRRGRPPRSEAAAEPGAPVFDREKFQAQLASHRRSIDSCSEG